MQAILTRITQRLHFLKQLKRVGVPYAQLLHFYLTVIRPVLEYAAPVWHHLITKAHTEQIEAVQRRAIRIIYSYTCDMPYINALYIADIPSLVDRTFTCSFQVDRTAVILLVSYPLSSA